MISIYKYIPDGNHRRRRSVQIRLRRDVARRQGPYVDHHPRYDPLRRKHGQPYRAHRHTYDFPCSGQIPLFCP